VNLFINAAYSHPDGGGASKPIIMKASIAQPKNGDWQKASQSDANFCHCPGLWPRQSMLTAARKRIRQKTIIFKLLFIDNNIVL